jgi:hypothetical protein
VYILAVHEDDLTPFRTALRDQLRGHLARPTTSTKLAVTAPLADSLVALAARARELELHAEALVILVKRELESAVVHVAADSGTHDSMRQLLVTSAIKAYYLQ